MYTDIFIDQYMLELFPSLAVKRVEGIIKICSETSEVGRRCSFYTQMCSSMHNSSRFQVDFGQNRLLVTQYSRAVPLNLAIV